MAKTERDKKAVPDITIPANNYEAAQALEDLGRHQRERERIKADMNDEMAEIKRKYEEDALPHGEAIARLLDGLHLYAEKNKDTLLIGKMKSAKLTTGEIGWRTGTPKVGIKGVEAVLERLKAMDLTRFIRVKTEPNKEAMLAEQEIAATVPGVTITQVETFWAKPAETELEEVAG